MSDFLVSIAAEIVGTGAVAVLALLFWRYGGQFLGDYRRLRVEACTLLTVHAPLFTNLPLTPTPTDRRRRLTAGDELRRVADRLTNTDCPPRWLARALRLPSPQSVWEAGRAVRALSNALFLPSSPTPTDKLNYERQNRQDCAKARLLLRCRAQRPSDSN